MNWDYNITFLFSKKEKKRKENIQTSINSVWRKPPAGLIKIKMNLDMESFGDKINVLLVRELFEIRFLFGLIILETDCLMRNLP